MIYTFAIAVLMVPYTVEAVQMQQDPAGQLAQIENSTNCSIEPSTMPHNNFAGWTLLGTMPIQWDGEEW